MNVCIYLRKSRMDREAELRGEGETLARHEKTLYDLANRLKIQIGHIFREIVSGETIAARPIMQELLSQIEQGLWDAVMVMEVERLARGNTIDQGIIAQTFQYSNTKIITPAKTYDPNNEFDEEYFEFGLFMSRREYKTINRRLQYGRLASVKEGKYVGNQAPYGYDRVKIENDKGYTLMPNANAEIVKMIYDLYANHEMGTVLIAKKLNSLQIKPLKKETWSSSSIRDILINPVYHGKVRWNWRKANKKIVDGQMTISRPRSISDSVIYDGLHEAIIDDETYNKVQEIMSSHPPKSIPGGKTIQNPLAGLIVCGKCGNRLVRRPYLAKGQPPTLLCTNLACDNISSHLYLVEERVLELLKNWIKEYRLKWNNQDYKNENNSLEFLYISLKKTEKRLDELKKRQDNIYSYFESGIYTPEVFNNRISAIQNEIEETKKSIENINTQIEETKKRKYDEESFLPKLEYVVDVYQSLPDAKAKNTLLKEVIEKAIYIKDTKGRWHNNPDNFRLTLYPKIKS